MIVTLYPSAIAGTIEAPASKSCMQRACAAALLTQGVHTIYNPGKSNDDLAALSIIEALGAAIIKNENGSINITSSGVRPKSPTMQCRESGLSARMFLPIAALANTSILIDGIGTILSRPMDIFDKILPQLNVQIQSTGGKMPIEIKGPLQPKDIEMDGSLSSQFLTGFLLAYASAAEKEVTIKVNELKSKPYIDLTLQVMKAFGLPLPINNQYEKFTFLAAQKHSSNIDYTIEGDWSNGAFLLVAGAIGGSIMVKGLDIKSTQADRRILDALTQTGCQIVVSADGIQVSSGTHLSPFHFDATDCPDLFPPLVALAAYCHGKSIIKGVSRLEHKESNRALTLQEEFGKMNVSITLNGDEMTIVGGSHISAATVHSHHDHRIAMACSIAALKAEGITTIEEAQAVNKSYPDFYHHLKQLGVRIFVQ